MNLYCQCGYAFHVSAVWTGDDYYLVLRDAKRGKSSQPIVHCPQCGMGLVIEDMELYPPTNRTWPTQLDSDPGSGPHSDQGTERTG